MLCGEENYRLDQLYYLDYLVEGSQGMQSWHILC
jgi:hypothetical protein